MTTQTHLTHADTRLMFEDALPSTLSWASVAEVRVIGDPYNDDTDPCTFWEVTVTEDEPECTRLAAPVTLDHEVWIATMRRMVSERDTIKVRDDIVEQIAAVLEARTNDDAVDEICQLDVTGFDAIVQFATLGELVYG
jgi:hypothetical protein